jgi:hypothetical protein
MSNSNSEFVHSHKLDNIDTNRPFLESENLKFVPEIIHVNKTKQRGTSLTLLNELNRNFLINIYEKAQQNNIYKTEAKAASNNSISKSNSSSDDSIPSYLAEENNKLTINKSNILQTSRSSLKNSLTKSAGGQKSLNNTLDNIPSEIAVPRTSEFVLAEEEEEEEEEEEQEEPKEETKGSKLWGKARNKLLFLAKFQKMNKNLQLFGTSETGFDEFQPTKYLRKLKRIQTEMEKEDFIEKRAKKRFSFHIPVLMPNDKFMYFWNTILLMLMIYTAFLMPFRIAFIDSDDSSGGWAIIENIIDFLFLFDCMLNFNIAFQNNYNHLIISRKEIALEYIKTWFIIDIVSSIPQNLLFNFGSTFGKTDLLRLAKLPKLYRLIKILRLIKLAKFFKQLTFIQTLENFFNINFGITKLITFLFSTLVMAHVVACMWYMLPKIYDDYNNWVVASGLVDEEVLRLYLFSIYWTFTTLLTVGFGDIAAHNIVEYCISIMLMLFGVGFYSFFIGTLSSILVNIDTKENILKNKLIILEEFCVESNLPVNLKEKIKMILVYNSQKKIFSWSDKAEIFNDLPANLKYEIANNMRVGFLKDIPFFSTKEDAFVATLVSFLSPLSFQEKDVVYKKNDNAMMSI